jgi:uncharacterized membrane protein
MSNQTPEANVKQGWLPVLRSRWWTALLGLSLMLNLLVVGLAFGARFSPYREDRILGASYVQLMPRDFFRMLPRERRKEVMQAIADSRTDLRTMREAFEGNAEKLAAVLEKDAYSADEVKAVADSFALDTQKLAARGGDVMVKIVGQLTAEERKALAASIRKRAERGKRRRN